MDPIDEELRSYYEAESRARLRPTPGDRRRSAAAEFARRLDAEDRTSVLDIGAGPASDHQPFSARGIRYVGVDLAVGNAEIGSELGQTVVPASLHEIPFADSSFSAGWSMSVLQHVPDDRIDDALAEMVRVLRPGSPVTIGLWGGRDEVVRSTSSTTGVDLPRLFVLRSHERIRSTLQRHLELESSETFPAGTTDWEYHLATARVPRSTATAAAVRGTDPSERARLRDRR